MAENEQAWPQKRKKRRERGEREENEGRKKKRGEEREGGYSLHSRHPVPTILRLLSTSTICPFFLLCNSLLHTCTSVGH